MGTKTGGVNNVRSNRGNMNTSNMSNGQARGAQGNGLGAGNNRLNAIWSDNRRTDGHGQQNNNSQPRYEAKSGSGSLLSESEVWAGRPNFPWNNGNTSSLPMGQAQTTQMAASPALRRTSDLSAGMFNDHSDQSYFALPRTAGMSQATGPASHRPYLHSGSEGASPSGEALTFNAFGGIRNGDGLRQQVTSNAQGSNPVVASFPANSPYTGGLDATRTHNVPKGHLGSGAPDRTSPLNSRSPFTQMPQNTTSYVQQRPSNESRMSYNSDKQSSDTPYGGSVVQMGARSNQYQIDDSGYQTHGGAQRPTTASQTSLDGSVPRGTGQTPDEMRYQSLVAISAQAARDLQVAYHGRAQARDLTTISPSTYSHISGSPMYLDTDSPTLHIAAQQRINERLSYERRLSAYSDQATGHRLPTPRMHLSPTYDYHNYQAAQLHNLQNFYPVGHIARMNSTAQGSRIIPRDLDPSQGIRSPLLEDFRANSKNSKRYELKDIYGHVVEFSGDQHGSRFIQQKLETANSDEKDQIFREIQENSLQLMTDVFGNYVVQKLFEHGNQSQKKVLANHMRGHVLALSTQMYGCRVVQKALEHVLVDQQAAIVKELENHVLKCVRDQNGNHVIQKAIERVPSQYVQFIIDAFRGQVNRHAAHPYGCRVIQRMLEHCSEYDRESILTELHSSTALLIPDQFGNYVIQHVIENGDPKDRDQMIAVVMSHLLEFSKHKFASNVVEKSIEFGDESQRRWIIANLTSTNERGEGPLLGLMRDQYGNYVIQKVLGQLKGARREALVNKIKPLLSQLKKFSYGKQIVAIEKLIYDPISPSTSLMTRSSTTPPSSQKPSPLFLKRSMAGIHRSSSPTYEVSSPITPPLIEHRASLALESSFKAQGLCHGTVKSISSSESSLESSLDSSPDAGVPIRVTGH
ncbi:Uncharacterized protein PECH_002964 [Penicillium ucsense]|uniref:Pumilio homology domain family member 3 n=1 Tax=Penicillium ucsense TaxID=2839758 RepID=A0A8J8WIF3_9EURO|nr:Uncharacterized protein PECM_003923 [Penicillium ucsense]KAF7737788.1 Uncharacterized protein PECH_002964 [Penicillium ucsense]